MTYQDIITTVGVSAAVIQTVFAAVSYYNADAATRKTGRFLWSTLMAGVCWAAVLVNYHLSSLIPLPFLQTWSLFPPATFQVTVNSSQVAQYKDKEKLLLVVRTSFSDIDRIEDQGIEKSSLYTIDGGLMVLAHASENKLRFLLQQPTVLEYEVALILNEFSADQVKNLGDIEKIGGRILAGAAQSVPPLQPSTGGCH